MRHDDLYLSDPLQALGELREYLSEHSREEFLADRFQQSFLYHRLMITGEAAVSLRRSHEAQYPQVPWAKRVGLRNRLVHAYFDLDLTLVWNIVVGAGDSTRTGPLVGRLSGEVTERSPPAAESVGLMAGGSTLRRPLSDELRPGGGACHLNAPYDCSLTSIGVFKACDQLQGLKERW